ncbi:hypothetical protein [Actinomadura xylanilytica]|uniref:hypothetical protein n=1 Tax=Actinomadura xylanilytica TaxID=887459 RepID=UPI00255A8EB9|nr:hypothetical protein [Actinomadura xylanilytica]MDL4775121.1 hypothetical protein [Actinomadura xylanilytica]
MKLFSRTAATAALAALGLAALTGTGTAAPAAPAAAQPPTPAFNMKDDCPALPSGAEHPEWWTCLVMVVAGGSMKLGGISQRFTQPMRIAVQASPDAITEVAMTGEPMTVPGGVLGMLGLPSWPGADEIPGIKLQVKPEYAGGFKLELPNASVSMRVQILNLLVGDKCFIGTEADPIKFNMAMDPNKLVVAAPGDPAHPMDDPTVLYGEAEDKTFTVPKTDGCGLVGPIADWKAGLPSPAGKNEASFQSFIAIAPYAVDATARRPDPRTLKIG